MIFPSNRVRIMVATKPIDFLKGHDSLAWIVKNELRNDPFTGTVFVFRARKADRLKLLYWDGTGLVMAYKRLEEHTLIWPAVKDGLLVMNHAQFEALFAGLDWRIRATEARAPEAVDQSCFCWALQHFLRVLAVADDRLRPCRRPLICLRKFPR